MKIVVGLGNIGSKYVKNRHNVGFITLDQLDLDWKEESKFSAIIAKKDDVIYVKPTTLMNNSGEAVAKVLNFHKEFPENLIVIYDDVDLPLGKIRVREKGSAGTHNGMKSVIEHLGTEEFPRIRIGIESRGETAPKLQDISSFVLSDFREEEIPLLKQSVEEALGELKNLLDL